MDLRYLRASNGSGEAVRAVVTLGRSVGATTLKVDSVANFPERFVATVGRIDQDGRLDPTTVIVFKGHLEGADIIIEAFAPGYSDKETLAGYVVLIKPTTLWADGFVDILQVGHQDDGKFKPSAVQEALIEVQSQDWQQLGVIPTVTSNNGQREHVIRYTGVDYTDRLSVGTKLRIPRTGTTPTQSVKFTSTNTQYLTKTSPSGLNGLTSAFTFGTWINLDNYRAGNNPIIGRLGSWLFYVNPHGRLVLYVTKDASNTSEFITYQSIPCGYHVHVGFKYDASTTTGTIYLDGIPLQVAKTNFGTGATSIATAGDLVVGKWMNAEPSILGTMAQMTLWNTALSDTNYRNMMNRVVAAGETNLVGAWQFNGNYNDTTTNNNHFTATGSVAFVSSNPFHDTEYAIVTAKPTFTSGNTDVTVFTGKAGVIPNTTLGTTSYSSARSPFGFPSNRLLWQVDAVYRTVFEKSFGSINDWYDMDFVNIWIPTGDWNNRFIGTVSLRSTVSGTRSGAFVIDYTTPIPNGGGTGTMTYGNKITGRVLSFGVADAQESVNIENPVSTTVLKKYLLFVLIDVATGGEYFQIRGDQGGFTIIAECPYI